MLYSHWRCSSMQEHPMGSEPHSCSTRSSAPYLSTRAHNFPPLFQFINGHQRFGFTANSVCPHQCRHLWFPKLWQTQICMMNLMLHLACIVLLPKDKLEEPCEGNIEQRRQIRAHAAIMMLWFTTRKFTAQNTKTWKSIYGKKIPGQTSHPIRQKTRHLEGLSMNATHSNNIPRDPQEFVPSISTITCHIHAWLHNTSVTC